MIKRQARKTNCQLKKQPVFSPQYIIAAKIRVCDLKYIICYSRTLCKTYDMTHICYFYQRNVKGICRQDFCKICPSFLSVFTGFAKSHEWILRKNQAACLLSRNGRSHYLWDISFPFHWIYLFTFLHFSTVSFFKFPVKSFPFH